MLPMKVLNVKKMAAILLKPMFFFQLKNFGGCYRSSF